MKATKFKNQKTKNVWLYFVFYTMFYGTYFNVFSQTDIYRIPNYSFIRYNLNHISFLPDSSSYDSLFAKINKLVLKGEGQLNIVHIGDSHIQADYFSGRMRERLQTFFLGGKGSRGFIFPFKLIQSNNAFNFFVSFTGNWKGCCNIEKNKLCTPGLAGASAITTDSISSVFIRLRNKDYPAYDFNKIKIFHNMLQTSFDIKTDNDSLKQDFVENDSLGYTQFVMKNYSDSFSLNILQTDTLQKSFTLYGISLENDDPGITYHSAGVNGADVEAFLRCPLFSYQLSLLSPDWVIVSLGTNDCYSAKWDTLAFEQNILILIKKIREAKPDVPILFTTPSDNYRRHRYHNADVAIASRIIIRIAAENKCSSWNLYEIMGGYGSMANWLKSGMAAYDKLHFNKTGYYLQGDLLFTAFLKAYDNYIDKMKPF